MDMLYVYILIDKSGFRNLFMWNSLVQPVIDFGQLVFLYMHTNNYARIAHESMLRILSFSHKINNKLPCVFF